MDTIEMQAVAYTTDTELAGLWHEKQRVLRDRRAVIDRLHHLAGEHKSYFGRHLAWPTTAEEITAIAARGGDLYADALSDLNSIDAGLEQISIREEELEGIWRRHRWQRYFPCLNRDGHIHATLAGCPSVYFTTDMAWDAELSGHTVEEAIAKLGTRLCSKCFPDAPAEKCNGTWKRDDAERERRAAAKAEREATRARKNLTADEQFDDHNGWKVTTVAGAQKAIRDEVELGNYGELGHKHPWHPAAVTAAARAREVLAGRGFTKEQLDQIASRKLAAVKKEIASYR